MTSWTYASQSKAQRLKNIGIYLIKKVEPNDEKTKFLWSESLLVETDLKEVRKFGLVVKYKLSNFRSEHRIHFILTKE